MKRTLFLVAVLVFGFCGFVLAKPNAMLHNTIGLNTIHIANSHIGFGAYYERTLTSKGRLSVILPASIGWEYSNVSPVPNNYNASSNISYYVNPGLKFYPFGNRKFFNYSFGMSFFSQMGKTSKIIGNVGGTYLNSSYTNYKFSTSGLSINNYLNFKINRHLSFGFEIGIGPSFYNNFRPEHEEIVVKGGTLIYQNIAFQIAYQF